MGYTTKHTFDTIYTHFQGITNSIYAFGRPFFCSFIFLPVHNTSTIFLPVHICFYPSKWRVDGLYIKLCSRQTHPTHLSFCREYLELVLPLVTGRDSRLAMSRLMEDFSSSKYMLSISLTTNFGNLRRCKRQQQQNLALHFPDDKLEELPALLQLPISKYPYDLWLGLHFSTTNIIVWS